MGNVIQWRSMLKMGAQDSLEHKFRKHVSQGFGLIETASLVSIDLPDSVTSLAHDDGQTWNRAGSVGKLLPGQAAQIRPPETSESFPVRTRHAVVERPEYL